MDLVFVDTGAFIALFSPNDEHRQHAGKVNADLIGQPVTRVTTNHVVAEACTWMLRRSSQRLAVQFGRALLDHPSIRHVGLPCRVASATGLVVVYTDPEIERAAWDIFARYDTTGFSFTDCVSFAVMQALGIKKAFSFDAHYDIMGFERL